MPLEALQSCSMIPLSCHVLPERGHVSPCSSNPPSGTRSPEQPVGNQVLEWTWLSRTWGEHTARQAVPTQQTAQVTSDPQPSLPPLPICGIRGLPLPGMFSSKCCSCEQTQPWVTFVLLHIRPLDLTYCSPNSVFG